MNSQSSEVKKRQEKMDEKMDNMMEQMALVLSRLEALEVGRRGLHPLREQ